MIDVRFDLPYATGILVHPPSFARTEAFPSFGVMAFSVYPRTVIDVESPLTAMD